jgi:hypothetical protein
MWQSLRSDPVRPMAKLIFSIISLKFMCNSFDEKAAESNSSTITIIFFVILFSHLEIIFAKT